MAKRSRGLIKKGKLDGSKNLRGTTDEARERLSRPGGPEPTPLDDRYAAGTPAGGTEVGGLAGTNIGDGDPDNADLEDAMGGGDLCTEEEEAADDTGAYSGHSGGAVGGTPAGGRAAGGQVHGGLAPSGTHRGDSTLGARPERG
jgi:hypothetical protein